MLCRTSSAIFGSAKMATGYDLQSMVLHNITRLDQRELGRGAYGRVYAVNYSGTICAAKEIHSILLEGVGEIEMRRTMESYLRVLPV